MRILVFGFYIMKIVDKKTHKRTKLHIKNCKICSQEFGTYRISRKVCSKECIAKLSSETNKKGWYIKCIICSKSIYTKPSENTEKTTRKFCSKTCQYKNKKLNLPTGLYYGYDGYIVMNKTSDGRKQIKYHRYLMEQKIGRILRDDEIVHHIDENKLNNDINNLQIMTRSEHNIIHGFLKK